MPLLHALVLTVALLQQQAVPLLHPISPMPTFSVTSVRPAKPGPEGGALGGSDADTYRADHTTLKDVIAYAFGTGYDGELLGGPSWISTEHFDVQGKLDAEDAAALKNMPHDDREESMRLRVQSLLKERFHLSYHFETREMAVYRLQVANSGLKCKRDLESKSAITDPARPRFRMSAGPPPPPPPPGWVPPSPAHTKLLQQNMHLRTRGWPFWLITTTLSHQPELNGKPVIDDTSLDGPYDCEMTWSREGTEGTNQYLFQAMQDQLGLKLVPSKGLVEVLVVDSVERPSEN